MLAAVGIGKRRVFHFADYLFIEANHQVPALGPSKGDRELEEDRKCLLLFHLLEFDRISSCPNSIINSSSKFVFSIVMHSPYLQHSSRFTLRLSANRARDAPFRGCQLSPKLFLITYQQEFRR